MITANILDPIHETLPTSVWDDPGSDQPKLKEQHRKWIERTVKQALISAGYSHVDQWLSLVLTGSLTTYQYGPESDCDISLFVDAEVFPEWSRAEMIGVMVSNVDGTLLPGTSFPMQCFVVANGITKEQLYQPGLRSGYDLLSEKWLQPPEKHRSLDVKAERYGMYAYALEQADKMERLLQYEPDKAVEMWHQIHQKRRRDQMAGKGDFALSNIIYKFLANRGLFKDISEASGEYIAKVADVVNPSDIKVQTYKYRPTGRHPRTEHGRSFPWIYTPETSTLHMGAADSYHNDLVANSPELFSYYGPGTGNAPVERAGDHIHGRMSIPPEKVMMFLGSPSVDDMQRLADRVGGSIAPADLERVQEGVWQF